MNVLSIGNSFSVDSHRYLHSIAKADNVELTTVNLDYRRFKWSTSFTLSHNNQRVIDVGNDGEVIPTFNNTHKEIQQISEFVKTLPNVKNMHLLPYHRMGEDKYKGLGRFYSLKNIEPMSDEYMAELLEVAKKYSGKNCQIGG